MENPGDCLVHRNHTVQCMTNVLNMFEQFSFIYVSVNANAVEESCDVIAALQCYDSVPTIGHVEFMTHNATADIIIPCE